ncbi:glutathione S-transferase family protein [Sinimarinibacterium sp. NLF-5-8]|uniref:glutathione S-transferase family protein n=1 Tax=Sinimarinibacterium sp. NLF-5-8 TaxID=2698684 RepID=UPI00137BCFB0|nr:glutathione S-transferase N-terminal domain-containing protein [Sinimarinibacterium sp. NLF-5-8]QHS11042.1 glutathione S-transferase family protein [Sinimarinibacterium sp. NLF-5-8]
MRLYYSTASPYSRKVRIALIEQGILDQVEAVLVDPFNPPADLLAANPLSKIPTLMTDQGASLPDSSLILDYLQTHYKGLAPLPRGNGHWDARRVQQVAEGIIDAATAAMMERRKPESIVYLPTLDRQAEIIHRGIELLEQDAGALLATEGVSTLDITTGVALAYLDFKMPYLEWRPHAAALAQWYEIFMQRPSMQQTVPLPEDKK